VVRDRSSQRRGVLVWLLAYAFITRLPALGDLNYFTTITSISTSASGCMTADPYVDLWDRKPPGLFALYYLFAGISRSVLSYQLAGWVSVALTLRSFS